MQLGKFVPTSGSHFVCGKVANLPDKKCSARSRKFEIGRKVVSEIGRIVKSQHDELVGGMGSRPRGC